MSRGGKKKGERTLTQELASFLSKVLVPDLAERAKAREVRQALEKRYLHEKAANRTAEHFVDWMERTVEQVGAAWVLSCLFIRTLEDRELLDQRRLAGPGAKDAYEQFAEIAPALTARDYLLLVFREVASLPAGEDVLGPRHNPAWRLSPSHEAARKLLDFFQEEADAGGTLKWNFTGTDTRFLGDIYQDLSEEVRKRYALLQTPDFVEKFILDLTLEPAIEEFGLEEVRLIDPTCGSGHFLLGAFERLFEKRRLYAPGMASKEHARTALAQVYGVDLNPYAVAIARFRLTLSFLEKAEIHKLTNAPRLQLNLVVADSLLYGGRHQSKLSDMDEDRARWGDEMFDLENPAEARRVFKQRYHAVVGNPPYITCKDDALRDAYRERYDSCYGTYALAAPFTERFFELAMEQGFVGLINANSFMKRDFGKPLIEKIMPRYDLSRVVDTSGAHIPGHGTPTVILFGRNRQPMTNFVAAVLGKRGEPSIPEAAEKGRVWTSIVENFAAESFDDEFISVVRVARSTLSQHPWSLGGGGAAGLKELLEKRSSTRLSEVAMSIGRVAHTGNDEAFVAPREALLRAGVEEQYVAPFVEGSMLRDWSLAEPTAVFFPYGKSLEPVNENESSSILRWLWPFRTALWLRKEPNGTHREIGLTWYELSRFHPERFVGMGIGFAFVSTHNHFVFDRGGKVFKQSAPVIKLLEGAKEEDYLSLLGYLNSSAACFWMKQVFFDKGNRGEGGGVTAESWEKFFEYDGTKLKSCPIPSLDSRIRHLAALLDQAATERLRFSPEAAIEYWSAVGGRLSAHLSTFRRASEVLEGKIRWLQEELDWVVYDCFGLATASSKSLPMSLGEVSERSRGSRPSDILYARLALAGETTARYFELCHLPAPSEIAMAPVAEVDSERLALIEQSEHLRLIETPTYKRTFREGHRPWNADAALRNTIRSIFERMVSSSKAGERVVPMREFVTLANNDGALGELVECLREGESHVGLEEIVRDVVLGDAVPYLAAWRHTESGMIKRHAWEEVWRAQRLEDAGDIVAIQAPSKYKADDYRSYIYFQMRGGLDVPRERFILYPGSESGSGGGPLLGWAGWNHLQRAGALAALYQEHKMQDGMDAERLTPLLAGLQELVPWLQQWHNEPNPDFNGERLGDYYAQFVKEEVRSLGLTLDDLRNWRPIKASAKKRATRKKASASDTEDAA